MHFVSKMNTVELIGFYSQLEKNRVILNNTVGLRFICSKRKVLTIWILENPYVCLRTSFIVGTYYVQAVDVKNTSLIYFIFFTFYCIKNKILVYCHSNDQYNLFIWTFIHNI